jgi:hypothetical protein
MRTVCSILGRPRRKWKDNITIYFKELVAEGCTGFMWLRVVSYLLVGSCEHSNEHICSMKVVIFLDQLSDCQVVKK